MKKKHSEKGQRIKMLSNVLKKTSEHEKEKSELKKVLKENRPKGYMAKKAGVVTFWGMISLLIGLFVILIIGNSSSSADNLKRTNTSEETQAVVDYGKRFLRAYLPMQFNEKSSTLTVEEERAAKLAYFTSNNLLDDLSKVYQDTHNVSFKDIFLHDAKIEGDTYLVTYRVDLQFQENPYSQTFEGDVKQLQTTSTTKYMTVKIASLPDTGEFIVYELPSFVAIKDEPKNVAVNEKSELKSIFDNTLTKRVEQFAFTFMDSYMKDSREKLSYLVVADYQLDGFAEELKLNKLNSVEVFQGAAVNEYLAYVSALVAETETGVMFPTTYTLAIVEEEGIFLVKALNDKSYIQQAIDYKLTIEEEKAK